MKRLKVALAGKPNSGKSSLFNQLTGLSQKTGNFPGVTVDKRTGTTRLDENTQAEIIDLPGIYSLYPRSLDEKIVAEIFSDRRNNYFPNKVILVADATNLQSSLLLLTQLIDLRLPTVLVLNMVDLAAKSGQNIDVIKLSINLDLPVVLVNARTGQGIKELKKVLAGHIPVSRQKIYSIDEEILPAVDKTKQHFKLESNYEAYQYLQQVENLSFLREEDKAFIESLAKQYEFFPGKYQGAETIIRYQYIQDLLGKVVLKTADTEWKRFSHRIDKVLTHKVWGYLIFFSILFLIFQSIFAWAQAPMDFIDSTFANLSNVLKDVFPEGPFFDLITQGIIPGIGGILIFVPQIAILFAFIAVLEETGYMSRVVFLMDKVMRKVGMSGKSVVPLISGWACAIPAIMATRTIENWKDRLITIFVTPLMSCSARLPVYAILVALIIPDDKLFGFFNFQGIALMGLYLLGFLAAIISALVMKWIIKSKERSYLIMELPTYRMPKWSNVGFTIVSKTRTFVFEAGKIILAVSIVLWVLASYGPAQQMSQAESVIDAQIDNNEVAVDQRESLLMAYRLEHSYAGIIGKAIEPSITPLGYDWKIGIALITSFAAREVFVGTMATIYSVGNTEDQTTIKSRLRAEINPDTGGPRFTLATGLSLLVFYTFAMQCMSTLAVVKRETNGWKWPMIQLVYMTALAYISALIVYQLFS
ncbi:MAG TPA: ferrous iron transport protein B [Cyclobacteriaceae bacterium]|mgnify:CR=1 FL=1|nr:ferrous iron transport protein B [Cyclobacteriaceae bacterium]HNP06669.1 ferrous iron transport protein B [Cyclobacteriaceae bacterium]HRK55611.1 ferrous iron transport protein B [Cyclobacteriaceae bacterium]